MKQEDLIKITAVADEEVIKCEILSKKENEITFVVDENLKRINYHCSTSTSEYIVREILSNRVAADQVHLVTSSFKDDRLCFSSKDVLFETIAKCFASHRPLVLSPDMIWLIISQSISNQINSNPEKYRDRVVSHDGKLNIKVRLPDCSDLINRPDEIDFADIIEMFYSKIDKLTKNDITPKLAADFTTTGPTERIASVITVMDAFKTYFNYILISCICGIPYIVLKGTAEDWAKLRAKTEILLDFDLEDWHKWLQPILFEFERASKGCPNKLFWRSIVSSISQKEVDLGRGCIPFGTKVDGWFLALFPFNSSGKRCAFEKGSLSEHKACEIMSVDFIYEKEVLTNNGIEVETHPMEMWAGFVGYKEEEETGALEPQIGWFIRQKDEKKEQLSALESMLNFYRKLEIEDEFPEVLKDLEERDTITFCLKKEIDIPDWVFKLKAEKLVFRGNFKFWKKMLNTLRYPNVKFLDLEEEDDDYVEEPEEMSEQEEPEEEATGFNNTTQKLDNEVQFTYQGVDNRICKGCIYVRGIVGNGEGCGRLGTENFRTRYLSGECEFKKTDLFKPSAFERKRMEEQRRR